LVEEKEYMPNLSERLPQNVAGRYYIDSTCVDCDLCRNTAPAFFHRDDEIGMSIVYRQPVTPEEIAAAEAAKQGCPTESIGNDGPVESTGSNSQSPCASAATGRVS
jgi:ferredoxin